MNIGYVEAPYLLPFDHRQSYVKSLVDLDPPLTAQQATRVRDGRTPFRDAVVGWRTQTRTRTEAVEHIAGRRLERVDIVETTRLADAAEATDAANARHAGAA